MSEKAKKTSWTPDQRKAIGLEEGYDNCQLIVAAGAGSGKTSVLTERILKKIKEGKDVTDFLVVTFTVASAEDMKEKLRKKLMAELALHPDNKYISTQITKLPSARISTMTSFCLDLVKKNFTVLGISPNVRMADENEAAALFERAMDMLLDDELESLSKEICDVMSLSGCRNKETTLAKYLKEIYDKIRAHPNYLSVLNQLTDKVVTSASYADTIENYFKSPAGVIVKKALDRLLSSLNNEIPQMLEIAGNYGKTLEEYANIHALNIEKAIRYGLNGDFQSCKDFCTSALSPDYRKGSPYKEMLDDEKAFYKSLKESMTSRCKKVIEFITEIQDNLLSDAVTSATISKGISHLITKLDEIYTILKREKGVIDFTDAEQLAHFLLLGENNQPTQLCKEIASTTEEVLVDEYQDTNPLQDSIFASLATKNNRFMVGDDKQSIYRFRNAYPDIFNGYKKEFNTSEKKCIFLKENFRCSKEIIDFTNTVFRFLWAEAYIAEQLEFAKGDKSTPTNPKNLVRVKVFEAKESKEKKSSKKESNAESSVHEAEYIGNEIKKLVGTYKKENGEYLGYSDIAIIMPALKTVGEIFLKKLEEMGIPAFTKKTGSLTSEPEVKLVLSILKAINNPQEDIPLASAMNSFFFGFTADELADIRRRRNTSLFGSVLKYIDETVENSKGKYRVSLKKRLSRPARKRKKDLIPHKNRKLQKKCEDFISRLKALRNKSRSVDCHKLIWELYENEGILSAIANTYNGETKRGNLLLLYTQAIEFGKIEYKTLSAFLKHADKLDVSSYAPESPDAVSIITIHSSKGLEFPVCFIANAGKKPVNEVGERMPVINTSAGIFTPLKDETFHTRKSVLYSASKILDAVEEVEEEKRELYVALTRARELMYIVGTANPDKDLCHALPSEIKTYLNWIMTANPECIIEETENVEIDEDEFKSVAEAQISVSDNEPVEEATGEFDDGFVYPYEVSLRLPRKLSVSQLKKADNDEYEKTIKRSDFLSKPSFALESKKISGTEVGTANHTFMQFASFKNCVESGVEAEGERLLLLGMITKEQYKMLNFKNLKAFFRSDLYKRISKSDKVFREKRFTISDRSDNLLGVGKQPVLVQGVIDLFFLNEDGNYTVVDYKTDRVKASEESLLVERYKSQIKYYAKAVEEMTGKKTTEGILYSFALNKEISISLDDN